ncbi:MAG TPA: glycosyltransferase family 4 protein [Halioglobus sp.]
MTGVVITFLLSVLMCGFYLMFARNRQLLDLPNERSSHTRPTPHGGGVALILAFTLGLLLSARLFGAWDKSLVTLAVAVLALMVLGIIDDLRGLSVRLRLALYSLVCLWVAFTLLYAVNSGNVLFDTALILLTALAMLWSLNLYNFMDGIDGIAAMQAVLACCCAAWLSWGTGRGSGYALFCLLFAAAHAGLLLWNYPPARLFMGDAGSVPTGFLLAALALVGAVQGQLNPLCWLVMLAAFVTDTTWTLVWRMRTGQSFTQAHRLHAYQRLSRYWGSHLKVDMLLLIINLLWLFPLAWAIQFWPDRSLFLVILAYVPLLCGMAKIRRLT